MIYITPCKVYTIVRGYFMDIMYWITHPFVQSVLIGLGVLIGFFIIRKPIVGFIFKIFEAMTKKTKMKADDHLLKVIRNPLKMLVTFTALYIVFKIINIEYLVNDEFLFRINAFALNLYRSVFIVFVFMILYNTTDESHVLFDEIFEIFDVKVDKLLVPFVSKIFRLLIFVICIAIIASEWGFDVNGFVAGLGLGGLAFALAAQDTLANTFGGAVIITEKPFTIGDWIIVDGIEGTVEDINFRSTKVRKFNKSVVTVPNSKIAKSNIINFSKRNLRRVSYELKLNIDTPSDALRNVKDGIEKMLIEHPGINNETIFVKFNEFDESSLNIFLYFFTNTSVWSEYLDLTEDTNFKILEILKNNDVKLAVPMHVVKMENEA